MSADEIVDWMAYYLSIDADFKEKLENTPIAFDDPEDEAMAIRKLLGWKDDTDS